MQKKIFKRKSSFSYPSREIASIVGAFVLMLFLIGIEIFLGREQSCDQTFWLICQLEESVFMDKVETFGFLFAIILFLLESPDRKKQAVYEAWKTIDGAKGIETSGARNAALRTINSLGESLCGLDAVGADLNNIDLEGSRLTDANLQKAFLRGANLENSNLKMANLQGAILRGANLRRTNFTCGELTSKEQTLKGLISRELILRELILKKLICEALIFMELI